MLISSIINAFALKYHAYLSRKKNRTAAKIECGAFLVYLRMWKERVSACLCSIFNSNKRIAVYQEFCIYSKNFKNIPKNCNKRNSMRLCRMSSINSQTFICRWRGFDSGFEKNPFWSLFIDCDLTFVGGWLLYWLLYHY
jgi:hypothetical protein